MSLGNDGAPVTKRPFCVALTGGVGSGKSVVAAAFAKLGVEVVDTDLIARELTAPSGAAIETIREVFGTDYLSADGGLDRKRMRQKVFADPGARVRLEGILHPMIRARVARRLTASAAPYVLLVVPLLVESGAYRNLADRILVVDCDPSRQIERIMVRDGINEAEAMAMLAAQTTREHRLAEADDVIENQSDIAHAEAEVQRLHHLYLRLAGEKMEP